MGRILKLSLGALVVGVAATLAVMGNTKASAQAGTQVFHGQCGVCHAATATATPKIGPRLFGVVGRRAGTLPGFAYSPAIKSSGLTWGAPELRRFLANPGQTVRGNRMPYAGLHNTAQMDNLISYLETLK